MKLSMEINYRHKFRLKYCLHVQNYEDGDNVKH